MQKYGRHVPWGAGRRGLWRLLSPRGPSPGPGGSQEDMSELCGSERVPLNKTLICVSIPRVPGLRGLGATPGPSPPALGLLCSVTCRWGN